MKSLKNRDIYIKDLLTGERTVFYECDGENGPSVTRKPEQRCEGGRAFCIRICPGPEGSEYKREYINEQEF